MQRVLGKDMSDRELQSLCICRYILGTVTATSCSCCCLSSSKDSGVSREVRSAHGECKAIPFLLVGVASLNAIPAVISDKQQGIEHECSQQMDQDGLLTGASNTHNWATKLHLGSIVFVPTQPSGAQVLIYRATV